MGTVGGNLFAPSPFGDFAVALLALDATVSVQGGYGAREMAIEEFLARARPRRGRARARRLLPAPRAPTRSAIARSRASSRKAGRVMTLAAHAPDQSAAASSARASRTARWRRPPVRAKAAERALEGRTLDAASIAAAVAAAAEGTSPANNSLASAWYRREVVGVHLRRLLARPGRPKESHGQDRPAISSQRPRRRRLRRWRRQSAQRAARWRRRHDAQIRLRPGRMRRLHGADRRRGPPLMPDARGDGRRPLGRNRWTASRMGPNLHPLQTRLHGAISPPSAAIARRAC